MVREDMISQLSRRLILAVLILTWFGTIPLHAAVTGNILSDAAFAEADAASLKEEANLFLRIKDGVMLSLAQCDLSETCSPDVGMREVESLLQTIDVRITTLVERYTETGNPELEQALLIYADARDGYARALDKLETLEGTGDEDALGEDDFSEDLESGDYSNLFEDTDEDL